MCLAPKDNKCREFWFRGFHANRNACCFKPFRSFLLSLIKL
jgi:hypothetical protein